MMNISAHAQTAFAALQTRLADKPAVHEGPALEAIQAAIDQASAPLLEEIAGLKREINALNEAGLQQQLKFNEELTKARAAAAVRPAEPLSNIPGSIPAPEPLPATDGQQ